MSGNEIREKYLSFMTERGHVIIPSSALIPENDPTTLFTGSGMQPLVPYLMGETHPKGKRLTNSQKCFRAEDIEEVGDNRHTTFFEMLGNWSLGDYFKKEQLPWFFSFLTDVIGLDPARIYVTAFAGSEADGIPRDDEASHIWQTLFEAKGVSHEVAHMGSEAEGSDRGIKDGERIFFYDSSKNWWSRAGKPAKMPIGEIGGPDSEVFFDFGIPHDPKFGPACHPNCDCGRFLEIGNSVFIEYVKTEHGFEKLPHRNVDFGGGLERIAAVAQKNADIFTIDLLAVVIKQIEQLSQKRYEDNKVAFRVITDHIRGSVFMIGDGVMPANTEQGYFVRRLLRRAVRYADMLGIPPGTLKNLAESVIQTYGQHYTNLSDMRATITEAISEEEMQFRKTLALGLKKLEAYTKGGVATSAGNSLDGTVAFELYTTHGFPIELTEEIIAQQGMTVDRERFDALMTEHKALSRAGAEQKFKGGLADHSDSVIAYHTTTHLLLAALRKELGPNIHQAGSNITAERLRFDFTYGEKIPQKTLDRIQSYVNDAISARALVTTETIPKSVAEADDSIEGSFWERYPDEVKVYTIRGTDGVVYSRELCGGPHVPTTEHIRGTFKIIKEESSSHGVRRIKAVLE